MQVEGKAACEDFDLEECQQRALQERLPCPRTPHRWRGARRCDARRRGANAAGRSTNLKLSVFNTDILMRIILNIYITF